MSESNIENEPDYQDDSEDGREDNNDDWKFWVALVAIITAAAILLPWAVSHS